MTVATLNHHRPILLERWGVTGRETRQLQERHRRSRLHGNHRISLGAQLRRIGQMTPQMEQNQ